MIHRSSSVLDPQIPARPSRSIRRLGAAAACAVALLGTSCGSDGKASDTTTTAVQSAARPITEAEASKFADVLVKNAQAKTANFRVSGPFGQGTVQMDGTVDWANSTGQLVAIATVPAPTGASGSSGAAPTGASGSSGPAMVQDRIELFYTKSTFIQTRYGLPQRLAERGFTGAEWIELPAKIDTGIGKILALVAGLAAESRDNPVTLMDKDVTFEGADTFDDVKVDVFKMGSIKYAVGQEDGRIHHVSALMDGDVVNIGFANWGKPKVVLPDPATIVSADKVPDLVG